MFYEIIIAAFMIFKSTSPIDTLLSVLISAIERMTVEMDCLRSFMSDPIYDRWKFNYVTYCITLAVVRYNSIK